MLSGFELRPRWVPLTNDKICFLFNINTDSYMRKLTATFVFQVFERRKKNNDNNNR